MNFRLFNPDTCETRIVRDSDFPEYFDQKAEVHRLENDGFQQPDRWDAKDLMFAYIHKQNELARSVPVQKEIEMDEEEHIAYMFAQAFGEWGYFDMTGNGLLAKLNEHYPESGERHPLWPKTPAEMGNLFYSISPQLNAMGVKVEHYYVTEFRRQFRLKLLKREWEKPADATHS